MHQQWWPQKKQNNQNLVSTLFSNDTAAYYTVSVVQYNSSIKVEILSLMFPNKNILISKTNSSTTKTPN